MDDRRFDELARGLAGRPNRRSLLKGMLGLGAVSAAGAALRDGDAEAARRPATTTPVPKCPGQQSWNGSACVCPGNQTICGAECCTSGESVCCDGACCAGECSAEEICCPPLACPSGLPDSLYYCGPRSDQCGNAIDCLCPDGWACTQGSNGTYCLNHTGMCIQGVTSQNYGIVGSCSDGQWRCTNTVDGGITTCVTAEDAFCSSCLNTIDCYGGVWGTHVA